MEIVEGYIPYLGHKTYYRIVGKNQNGKKPLLLLHGGPGSTHNYFEVLDSLAETGRQIITYDQIGCGNSYLDGHPELWNLKTWTDELIEVRKYLNLNHCHILGQSWGGMLLISYLIDQKPVGVQSAILSGTLPSNSIWCQEQHRQISYLPKHMQDAIAKAEKTESFDDPDYLAANDYFMNLHCAGAITEDSPECLKRKKKSGTECYICGWGPNEYNATGSLRDYNYTDRLHEINVPCLITSGTEDLCTPIIAKTMFDRIKNSKWELFAGCRHMPFVEDNEHYISVLSKWLDDND